MSADTTETELKHVVLDSAVFLSGSTISLLQKFFSIGAELVTIREVIDEIRDGAARARLESLPFRIETREPTSESMAAVARFARETGDISVLSVTDLKVLALTYQLEVQHHGTERIRQHPKSTRPILASGRPVRPARPSKTNQTISSVNEICEQLNQVDLCDTKMDSKAESPEIVEGADRDEIRSEDDHSQTESPDEIGEIEEVLDEREDDDCSVEGVVCSEHNEINEEVAADQDECDIQQNPDANNEQEEQDDDDDDDGEWITVQNLHRRHRSGPARPSHAAKPNLSSSSSTVTCITTDFAMQNVLVQMGLRLTALDGYTIRSLAQWVLRCCACMKITLELERIFCPSCGGQTLTRSRVKVTSGGWIKYKHSRPKPSSLRGTIYSIPKPKGGRKNNDLILREDQLLKVMPKTKKKSTEDLFEEASEFAWRKAGASLRQQVGHPRGRRVNEPIKKNAKRKQRR